VMAVLDSASMIGAGGCVAQFLSGQGVGKFVSKIGVASRRIFDRSTKVRLSPACTVYCLS